MPAKNKKEAAMRLMPALFMLLLLLRTAFILFEPSEPQNAASDIDVITRTSCAALYAYFVSTASSQKELTVEGGVLALIGLISLALLFGVRGYIGPQGRLGHSATGSLVQMRDFLSGCIGFLVSRKKK